MFAISDPLAAYQLAFELAFMDVGLARDITAVHAAIVSLLVVCAALPEAAKQAFAINPFGIDPAWRHRVADWLAQSEQAPDGRALCAWLADICFGMHPFDPVGALGTAHCCAQRAGTDFRRAVLLSMSQWELSREGQARRMRDVDCFGSITGSLTGAIAGLRRFPSRGCGACRKPTASPMASTS